MDLDEILLGAENVVEDSSMSAGGSEETQPVTNKSVDEILKAAMNLKTITWEDIEVSAGDTCKVDNTKKSLTTKLKGFSVGGNLLLTENIKSDVLQKIAHYFNVKRYRTNKNDENAQSSFTELPWRGIDRMGLGQNSKHHYRCSSQGQSMSFCQHHW
jgi:hypothetical protein